jgi:hypothetical protein
MLHIRKWLLITFMVSISLCAHEKITVLTGPIGSGGGGGHHAVNRSLQRGLEKIGANFNWNPVRMEDVGPIVHVLCDPGTLKQCIELKKQGKIKRLLAGPNLMIRSNEYNHILASPEIDFVIVPCRWVEISYIQEEPTLENRIRIWYVGVDISFWTPNTQKKIDNSRNVVVYWKTEREDFCKEVESILKFYDYNPIRLKYGAYNHTQYKEALAQSLFAVVISVTESQGVALAEAWAMDVPTLVWERNEPLHAHGKIFWPIGSCPYLTEQVGRTWRTTEDLKHMLKNISGILPYFQPRKFVLESMSDEICARNLLSIAYEISNK